MSQERNLGLDVARAVAITLVLVSHIVPRFEGITPLQRTILDYYGAVGVELFFSLSGFLIGQQIIDFAAKPSPPALATFWFRRWMRTLPLYYFMLVAVSVSTSRWDVREFFFLQNFDASANRQPVLGVAWSLAMEEWFYLGFPVLVYVASVLFRRRSAAVVTAITAVAVIVACSAARLLAYGYAPSDPTFHIHPLMRLDCAAYGVLAACIVRSNAVSPAAIRQFIPAGMTAVAIVMIILTALAAAMTFPAFWPASGMVHWGRWYLPFHWTAINVVSAVFVLLIAHVRWDRNPSVIKQSVTTTSRLSYSIYLTHAYVVMLMFPALAAAVGSMAAAIIALACTFAASAVTYAAIERPFLQIRDAVLLRLRSARLTPRPAQGG
ncbi:acyltransferase [Azorhizobium oxalatiphilum]|uniref:Acyltransferase n=1 Tax=Azorhizobium oxalatiphilum TaxID=980631 RepID=A0A917BKC3_9HYPH|nr:acyltransferase [Azorhizobium oxalatiphilum]GGF49142.1 acyltransferase [Azorhizobium oxalatiphilum]